VACSTLAISRVDELKGRNNSWASILVQGTLRPPRLPPQAASNAAVIDCLHRAALQHPCNSAADALLAAATGVVRAPVRAGGGALAYVLGDLAVDTSGRVVGRVYDGKNVTALDGTSLGSLDKVR
jgi:hypothetical protein